jgi:hypothetical protein
MGIVSAVVGDAAHATNVSPSVLTQNRIFDRFTNDLDRQTRQFQYISARRSTLSWQLYLLYFHSSRTADEAVEYYLAYKRIAKVFRQRHKSRACGEDIILARTLARGCLVAAHLLKRLPYPQSCGLVLPRTTGSRWRLRQGKYEHDPKKHTWIYFNMADQGG